MGKCEIHGEYHDDACGCGTAVISGMGFAEHIMGCPRSHQRGPSMWAPRPPGDEYYHPWEAPAGNCPWCWHKANPGHNLFEDKKEPNQ